MTKEQVIQEVCTIVALAYHSISEYKYSSDGFCSQCDELHGDTWNYQNHGHAIDYVRQAVVNQLKRDGYTIAPGFCPVTGKELLNEVES